MKKLILTLLLIPSLCWAADPIDWSKPYARMGVVTMGAGVAAADTEVTLQNGLNSYAGQQDNRLDALTDGTNNNGAHDKGLTGWIGGRTMRELQRWDLSGIAAGKTCVSAKLYLYDTDDAARTENTTLNIYKVAAANADWAEGTTADAAQTGSSCWAYKAYHPSTPTSWAGSAGLSTATTDYDSTAIGSGSFVDGGSGFKEITLNAAGCTYLETLFGGTGGGGFIIRSTAETTGSAVVWSSGNNTTAANRPKLVITYH